MAFAPGHAFIPPLKVIAEPPVLGTTVFDGTIGSELFCLQRANTFTTPAGAVVKLNKQTDLGHRSYSPAAAKTTVSGTVTVATVATGGLTVVAYSKRTFDKMGQTTTAGDGTYSIECGGSVDVFVVAFDPTTYQAIIYDEVVPG
jgi:hypothetical protein